MSRTLGRYELLRPLARGGMGEVYLARRRAAGVEKWLVVKRMRPERAGDTRFLDLFMREAKLTMSLAHQNIVPVFDFGRIDDQVFLAMERVEGKDLGSSLQKAGKGLPPLLAGFIAGECLQALDYAHHRKGPDGTELGIVHRDVTPRNVLLSWSGEVKLTDFGIAALAADSPSSKTAGTPAYMAPEQARGEPLDVRADIYAVGLVLREALAGERARRGNDRETMLEVAKHGLLDPWPDGLDLGRGEPLRAIADRATAGDKTLRYADARAMLEDIDRYMVAERAAHQGDPPARQLAAWLDDLWKDAREEDAIDAQIEAGVLVSFLDDGGLDVLGTGTHRSMLATATDASASAPAHVEVEATDRVAKPDAKRASSEASAARDDVTRAREPAKQPSRARLALAAALVAAIAIPIVVMSQRSDERARVTTPAPDATLAMTPPADAAVEVVTPADAEAIAESLPADAAIVAPADAAIAERVERPRPRPTPRATGPLDAGTAATAATRRVTINSKPWSNWTVDGGAPHAGLATIALTPGTHVIHFTGNPYFKADKKVTIDVPDRDGFTHVETLPPPSP